MNLLAEVVYARGDLDVSAQQHRLIGSARHDKALARTVCADAVGLTMGTRMGGGNRYPAPEPEGQAVVSACVQRSYTHSAAKPKLIYSTHFWKFDVFKTQIRSAA